MSYATQAPYPQTDLTTAPAIAADRRFVVPWLSLGLVALLVAVLAAEQHFALGSATVPNTVSVSTLVALGGTSRNLTHATGEWYRLLTAPFLHLGIVHLILNLLAIISIGPLLERMIGRAWLATTYLIAALGGSLASQVFLAANLTSVGASGAIMGLLTAAFILSYRLPKGSKTRKSMQRRALFFLLPSLLPFVSPATGIQVDYSAHIGGAATGCIMGFVLLALWPQHTLLPRLRGFAMAFALAGAVALLASAGAVAARYPRYEVLAFLIPRNEVPVTMKAQIAAAPRLLAAYPHDPRSHAFNAFALLSKGDTVKAEVELREALRLSSETYGQISPVFVDGIRLVLASQLVEAGRTAEARSEVRSFCQTSVFNRLDPKLQKGLSDTHLCD